MEQVDRVGSGGLTRRQVLKRGAVAGVATAWAVPVVQAIAMNPSHADTPSGPVKPNQPHVTTVSKSNSGGGTTQPVATDPISPGPVADGPLPDTGASAPVGKVAIGGAAAIALGAGVYAASGLGKTRREAAAEESGG